MITLTFNWAWVLVVLIILIGLAIAYPLMRDSYETFGFSGVAGCAVMIIAVLLACVIGGIYIW